MAAETPFAHEPAPELAPTAAEQRGRVLIVDDDADQAEVLAVRLGQQGFEAWTAHSCRDGLAICRTRRPDLVLLDLRLPDGDGLEVCRRIADDPEAGEVRVIVVSAVEGPDIVRRTRAAGGAFYLRKPYDPNVLLALVESLLAEA